jgi:hypothetical protein
MIDQRFFDPILSDINQLVLFVGKSDTAKIATIQNFLSSLNLMLLQIKLSNFQIPSVIKKDYRLLEC